MKIIYIGNFQYSHCTETHLALTLEDMGHQVTRIQETPALTANSFPSLNGCDLMLWTRTPDLFTDDMPAILELCKQNEVPTASYHLDLYIGLYRQSGLDSDPFWRTDYVFSPDGDPESARIFKEKGINHFYIKPAVYKGDCYMVNNPKDKDVIFVGSKGYHAEYPYRPELVRWLRDTYGERFEHWGNDGLGTIRNDPLNQLYGSTKVVVGDSLILPNHTHYWSDRVYETLGRGGFIIHPFVEGLEEEFGSGTPKLAFYKHGDFEQLKELIDYYLENEVERENIRVAGHHFVKSNATYNHRLKQMLEIADVSKNLNPDLGNN